MEFQIIRVLSKALTQFLCHFAQIIEEKHIAIGAKYRSNDKAKYDKFGPFSLYGMEIEFQIIPILIIVHMHKHDWYIILLTFYVKSHGSKI